VRVGAEEKIVGRPYSSLSALKGGFIRKMGTGFFVGPAVRGQGVMVLNLKEGRFRLDIRKKFFTMRVVKHWNRFPKEAVEAPSLETRPGWTGL